MNVLRTWETYGPSILFMALGIAKKMLQYYRINVYRNFMEKEGIMIIQGKLSRHLLEFYY